MSDKDIPLQAIWKLVSHLYDDEKRNYEESDVPRPHHIFHSVCAVKEWLQAVDPKPEIVGWTWLGPVPKDDNGEPA